MAQQDTDIEALQAQIELSNSVAFDIVSSWMKKPSTSTSSSSSASRVVARDLEELARRPPRLGLGATVSKSTAATIREAARLKGKLSNKPVRDRGEVLDDKRKKEDEEEDEDSRNTAIVGRKTTITATTAGSNKRAGIADVFASRKKAKRVEKGTAETKADDFFEEWTGFSEQVSVEGMPDDVVPDGPPSTPSSSYSPPPLPPPPPPLRNRSESERRGSGGSIKVRQAVSLSPVSRPTLSRVDSSTTTTTSPVPLLNLFGPPPVPSSVESSKTDVQSTKKEKRRRRRKKQRSDRE